ncbi:uncharacterized protein LOC114239617 [Bombyx mandarina]|uniref:Uncharacterized protein LOC114239617 n=1 Tax=Bombyx mandarina TaxID=7092 RepID=A0A6J2J8G6_BOMMA|nr:uncharacterized protein LOC114239617 [Bombyx mandarina]
MVPLGSSLISLPSTVGSSDRIVTIADEDEVSAETYSLPSEGEASFATTAVVEIAASVIKSTTGPLLDISTVAPATLVDELVSVSTVAVLPSAVTETSAATDLTFLEGVTSSFQRLTVLVSDFSASDAGSAVSEASESTSALNDASDFDVAASHDDDAVSDVKGMTSLIQPSEDLGFA